MDKLQEKKLEIKVQKWAIIALFVLLALALCWSAARAWTNPYISEATCSKVRVSWPGYQLPPYEQSEWDGFIQIAGEDFVRHLQYVGNDTLETSVSLQPWQTATIEIAVVINNGSYMGVTNVPYEFQCVPPPSLWLPVIEK